MESFYGGRQGASFVIKKSFKYKNKQDPAYIKDSSTREESDLFPDLMEENLSDPNYKEVWYNEYCIIDTTNKNNPRNGEVYRRTLQTQDGKGNVSSPYEYIGQIVGPSAGVPMLNIRPNLLTSEELQNDLGGDWDGLGWEDAEGNKILYDPSVAPWLPENGTSTIKTALNQLEYSEISAILKEESFKLVPGYDPTASEDERYNDTIRYNWYNVRKNTEDNAGVVESWCYIGMKIPYTVFTKNYKTIHSNEINVYETEKSKQHNFWYDYMFEIPRGQRGISVVEIFTNEILDENGKVKLNDDGSPELIPIEAYDTNAKIEYNTTSNEYTVKGELKTYDVDKGWFCKLQIFNPQPVENKYSPSTPEELVFYIGASTEIKNVSFDTDTGKFEIQYNNRASSTGQFKYVTKIYTDNSSADGKVYYDTTAETKKEAGQLDYVTSVYMDDEADNGQVYYDTTTTAKQSCGQLVFVDDVQITSAHELLIAFTDNSRIIHDAADEQVLNGKTYINYGQTIGKLGIESSPITGPNTEKILEQFESTYPQGVKDGEVTGQLFVVTTSDENNPISYFVMWNPDTQKWEIVSEIAGSPIGIPAQIGSDLDSWTYQDNKFFADGYVQFTQLFGNENTIDLTSWWK